MADKENEISKVTQEVENKIKDMMDGEDAGYHVPGVLLTAEEGGKNLEKNRYIIIGVIILVLAGYFVLCERIYNNGSRADEIRAELRTAAEQLSSVQQRLLTVEKGLTDSQKRIDSVQKRIDTSVRAVESAEARSDAIEERNVAGNAIIDESERILREIRARGQSGSKKP